MHWSMGTARITLVAEKIRPNDVTADSCLGSCEAFDKGR